MIETKINLSINQIRKIAAAHKSSTSARIRLSYEEISGKGQYKVLLNKALKEKLDANKKQEKGSY